MSLFRTLPANSTLNVVSGDITIEAGGTSGDNIILSTTGTGEVRLTQDPTTSLGVATKQYIDNAGSNIVFKSNCRLVQTASLGTFSGTSDGIGGSVDVVTSGSGIGKTLTNDGVQAALTIDSVAAVVADRVLIMGETGAASINNGIYTVTNIGSGSTNWVLTRAIDCDESSEILTGMYTYITAGTANAGKSYILTTGGAINVDSTQITFAEYTVTNASGALGGQTLVGGTAAGENLTLESTSNATKGAVIVSDPLNVSDIDTAIAGTLTIGPDTATKVEIADTGVVTEVQGALTVEGSVDTLAAGTLTIGPDTATKIEIADTGVITEVQGPLDALEGLDVTGAATVSTTLTVDDVDANTATTLLIGKATATKVEIADAGVTTEVQGPLTIVGSVDTISANTLTIGHDVASKVEIADTTIVTEVQGPLDALEGLDVTGAATVSTTLAVDDIDANTATTLLIGKSTATKVEIADTGVTTEVQGTLDVVGGIITNSAAAPLALTSSGSQNITLTPGATGQVLLKEDPISALGAATKQYVDNTASGLDAKESCRLHQSVSFGTLAGTSDGVGNATDVVFAGSGIGKTLTNDGVQVALTIDSVAAAASDRVLVSGDGIHNGIYIVTNIGSGSTNWVLTRATDADEDAEVTAGMFTFIVEGTVHADTGWVLSTNDPVTVDTSPQTFVQFSSAGSASVASDPSAGGGAVAVYSRQDGSVYYIRELISDDSTVSFTVQGTNSSEIDISVNEASVDHNSLNNLAVGDVHTQYALIGGRATGQTIIGSTASGQNLTLQSNTSLDGVINVVNPIIVDDIDARTATTLLVGKSTATKIELADAGVTTEVQGPLTVVSSVDTATATTLLVGHDAATKVEIADAGVTTEIQGPLEIVSNIDTVGASIMLVGAANATKVEIADAGVTTEVQGPLTVLGSVDTVSGVTMTVGAVNATKVEIADTGIITEVQGTLNVEAVIDRAATGTLSIGTVTANRVEIGTVGNTTEVVGRLEIQDHIDTGAAATMTVGRANATKLELADAGVTTEVKGPLTVVSSVDTSTATTLLVGHDAATKVEIADAGVTTEIQGPLTVVSSVDTVGASIMLVGAANATKVEIADTSVTTEIQGPLSVLSSVDTFGASTLTIGTSSATKVEIADTGVTTEIQGTLDVIGATITNSAASDLTISSASNQDILLTPGGTGVVVTDSIVGSTSGSGTLSLSGNNNDLSTGEIAFLTTKDTTAIGTAGATFDGGVSVAKQLWVATDSVVTNATASTFAGQVINKLTKTSGDQTILTIGSANGDELFIEIRVRAVDNTNGDIYNLIKHGNLVTTGGTTTFTDLGSVIETGGAFSTNTSTTNFTVLLNTTNAADTSVHVLYHTVKGSQVTVGIPT